MRGGKDPISVIEAAYQLEVDDEAWLDGIVDGVAATLDQGLGCYAWTVDFYSGARVLGPTRARGRAVEITQRLPQYMVETPADLVRDAHPTVPFFGTLSRLVGPQRLRILMGPLFAALGFADQLGLLAMDPETGQGVGVSVPLPRAQSAPRPLVARWGRVSSHLGLALRARLRLQRAGGAGVLDGADAVLRADGRVEHAEGEAAGAGELDALRRAARAVDRARGRLRSRDADEAVEIWRGLVSGRWSLVDHHDTDGRRYLVARRNDPHVPGPPTLDCRDRSVIAYRAQGHPLKLIAYELGLSIATVSASLARARAVLGVRDEDFARAFSSPPPIA